MDAGEGGGPGEAAPEQAVPEQVEPAGDGLSGHDPRELLTHANPKARLAGALMCYEETDEAVRQLLLARIGAEEDAFVRASLVKGLANYPDAPVIESLTRCLSDPDPRVRSNTIEALMFYEHPALFSLVSGLVHDPDNRVQGTVLVYLARRKPDRVRPILEKMAASNETWARSTAGYAFRTLGWALPPATGPEIAASGPSLESTDARTADEGAGLLNAPLVHAPAASAPLVNAPDASAPLLRSPLVSGLVGALIGAAVVWAATSSRGAPPAPPAEGRPAASASPSPAAPASR